MKMSDLKRSDGFPKDIDRTHRVVVCVRKELDAGIFYINKEGNVSAGFLWSDPLYPKFKEGIYIINP